MISFTNFFHWFWYLAFGKQKYTFQGYDLNQVFEYDCDEESEEYDELSKEYAVFLADEVKDNENFYDLHGNFVGNDQKVHPVNLLDKDCHEDENKCSIRSGIVTNIYNESGLIDNVYHFDLRDAPVDLCLNDVVTYLAFKPSKNEEWIVRKIYSFEERNWEVEDPYTTEYSVPSDLPKGTFYRSVVGQVTERNGREVIINNGEFRFDLSSVSSLFIPIVGDFIYLDALVVQDENQVDFAGEILNVEKIRWVRFKQDVGKVSKWFKDVEEGQIDNYVSFKKDSCAAGYVPTVGDKVIIEMIESYQGTCSWRALSVSPAENVKKQIRNLCKAPASETISLCQSNSGISLNSYEFKFEKVHKAKTGHNITVYLSNNSSSTHVLLYGDFYKARSAPQVYPLETIKKIVIDPGATKSYSFCCLGKNLGTSNELFVFCFEGFKVGCNFIVEVIDPESSVLVSYESARSNARRQHKLYKGSGMTSGQRLLGGIKPILPPKFIEQRLKGYTIPERFWNATFDSNGVLNNKFEIQEKLEALVPSFLQELSIHNYISRFHSLLHLEEIEATLNLQHYNMEKVIFRHAGPAKEYLSLEVPGLAEKRPSLLVGDAVHAYRPWKEDGLVFEGFIHKTLCTKVWLKFNSDFHLGYSGDVYDVKFIFSRTAIRRQHSAVDMAITHLGPQMLFPSRLDLKPPQIEIEIHNGSEFYSLPNASNSHKKKLKWVNLKLNCYQKEAIKRVLEGEARPLPYVIFGPPGTGKTMTMVELILQIFFLMPDSRLLVATPSNSSANLIAERLLDSQLLKPGDLVRLVGYHVLEEGSLPERLRPYSTTGNIKSVSGEEAMPTPIGQLGPSSNKLTLGRHRITVGTCIALGQLYNMGFPRGHFTHVLVDEAGQATEPEIMVPLDFIHSSQGQVILAGDPMQLGPIVVSSAALNYGLGVSYLERLIQRFPYERDLEGFPNTLGYDPRLVTRLIKNYRSLPEILELPNELFYDSSLEAQVSSSQGEDADLLNKFADLLPKRSPKYTAPPAIVFHGVVGTNLQDLDSPSWFNPQETLIAMTYLTMCYSQGLEPDDIGIITPYRSQAQKMRWYYDRFNVPLPKIGSVEEFQGQERRVIILSTVRSSSNLIESDIVHSLGFVASRKRLNVAITRARSLLVIVGNPHVLAVDRDWRCVLQYCTNKEAYIGCDSPLDSLTLFSPERDEDVDADVDGV